MRVVTFLRSICHVCPHGLVGSFTTTTDSQVEFHWVQCVRLKYYAEKLIGSSDSSCAAFQLYLIFGFTAEFAHSISRFLLPSPLVQHGNVA